MFRSMDENRKRWVKVELTKTRAKTVIDVYVKMLLSGKSDLHKLAEMYRPDSLIPIATLKRFLKQKEVKQIIDAKLNEGLKLNGIDMEFIIKNRIEILRGAMKKEDYSNANRVLDSFEDKLDLKHIEDKNTYGAEFSYVKLLGNDPKLLERADTDI
jgi:hypothetical protein